MVGDDYFDANVAANEKQVRDNKWLLFFKVNKWLKKYIYERVYISPAVLKLINN